MKWTAITTGLLFLALIACDLTSEVTFRQNADTYRRATLGDTLRIHIFETVRIDSTDYLVTFSDVTGDSRCPQDVVCIWPGEATALLTVRPSQPDSTLLAFVVAGLYYGPQGIEHEAYGFTFTVDYLDPYPSERDTGFVKSDYSVVIKIEKQ